MPTPLSNQRASTYIIDDFALDSDFADSAELQQPAVVPVASYAVYTDPSGSFVAGFAPLLVLALELELAPGPGLAFALLASVLLLLRSQTVLEHLASDQHLETMLGAACIGLLRPRFVLDPGRIPWYRPFFHRAYFRSLLRRKERRRIPFSVEG